MPDKSPKTRNIQSIDWDAIWRSLDWDDAERQQSDVQQRLKQRAELYAQPSKRQESSVQQQEEAYQLLTFDLGSERYGIDVRVVTSVRAMNTLTRVPGSPTFYRGVVNVRGQIITVLDLRIILGLGMETSSIPEELIVVKANQLELGILADHVSDVERIPVTAIELIEMQYARGVTMGRLVVLDIEQLLTDERLVVGGVDDL